MKRFFGGKTDFIVKIFSFFLLLFVLREFPGHLGKVVVSVFGTVFPRQILLLDEDVDALLDHLNLGLEPGGQLVQDLGHQLLVLQNPPRLHDPDDGGLDQQLPVFLDVFVRQFHFLLLLRLHRDVDVHPELLVLVAVEENHDGAVLQVVLVDRLILQDEKL